MPRAGGGGRKWQAAVSTESGWLGTARAGGRRRAVACTWPATIMAAYWTTWPGAACLFIYFVLKSWAGKIPLKFSCFFNKIATVGSAVIIFLKNFYCYFHLMSPLAMVIFNYGVVMVKLIVHGFATILSCFFKTIFCQLSGLSVIIFCHGSDK